MTGGLTAAASDLAPPAVLFSCCQFVGGAFFITFSLPQEVLLKRAADLVEALYGMPHNNQVMSDTCPHCHKVSDWWDRKSLCFFG